MITTILYKCQRSIERKLLITMCNYFILNCLCQQVQRLDLLRDTTRTYLYDSKNRNNFSTSKISTSDLHVSEEDIKHLIASEIIDLIVIERKKRFCARGCFIHRANKYVSTFQNKLLRTAAFGVIKKLAWFDAIANFLKFFIYNIDLAYLVFSIDILYEINLCWIYENKI